MSITNWSIRHAITVLVLIFVIIVAGLLSYRGLPREAAPDITIPVVLVSTPYVGVSPADIEKLVTRPIEDELESLKDVRKMSSTSADGASIISIEFEPDVDIESALQKVREKVDQARPELPADLTDEPAVQEISFSEFPIMVINVSSAEVGLSQLEAHAENLQDELERIEGVLDVKLVGGLEREITIEADPALLEYYHLSLGELSAAIQGRNLNMPGGAVELGELRYPVRVPGELRRVPEIADIVVREVDGEPIRVGQVARVYDGFEEQKTHSRVEGQPSLSLSLTRRSGENVLRIATEVKDVLEAQKAEHGDRIEYTIVGDISKSINDRVAELENSILTGLLLVSGVLLFFMGGLRNAFFVAIAIPMSMLVSFAVLAAMGITLNMVVLFALVLALGMLVDNAIVIVENIYRHANMGKTLTQAAMDGTGEVAWPVIASTLTTVFAFFPMMFWPGIMGEFMYYLPLTVVVVLLASLFVALVINPVVCALFMRVKRPRGYDPDAPVVSDEETPDDELGALPDNLIYRAYGGLLRFSLRHRWVIGIIVVVGFFGTFAVYGKNNSGVEFFPEMTPERIYVNVTLPDGSNLEASDRIVTHVEQALFDRGNIKAFVADVGAGNGNQMDFGSGGTAPHRSRITVEFQDVTEQVEDPYKTIDSVRAALDRVVGADVEVVKEEGGPPTGPPINVEIVGDDYVELGRLAARAEEIIKTVPNAVNVKSDYQSGRPEIAVRVLPDRAADMGLSTADIANTVRMAINGMKASVFRDGADEYDIIVKLDEPSRDSVEAIERLRVKSNTGQMVRLTEVAEVVIEPGFGSIRHIDGDRVVTVSAETTDSQVAAAALAEAQSRLAAELEVPAGYELRYTGQNKEQEEAQTFLTRALLGGLFLIALVLVTQFNSVVQPFIILCSVVLSLLGVLWTLMLRDMPFGVIMTGIGIISLAGVVVNNAIVLIDYTNQLRSRGMKVKEALYTAGMVRFRPVLLTAMTTILSLMPIVLGYNLDVTNGTVTQGGSSVEMWSSMANAVVGGLTVATVLTLIVVPVLYSSIESGRGLFRRLFRRGPVESDDLPPPRPRKKKVKKGRKVEPVDELTESVEPTDTSAEAGDPTPTEKKPKKKRKDTGRAPEIVTATVVLLAAAVTALAPVSAHAQGAGDENPVVDPDPGDTVIDPTPATPGAEPREPAVEPRPEVDIEPAPVATPPPPTSLTGSVEDTEPVGTRPVITFTEARQLVRQNNDAMEIVEVNKERAEILAGQTFNLAYPQVLFTASYTLNDAEIAFEQPNIYAPLGPYLDSVYANDPALQAQLAADPTAVDARLLAAAPGVSAVVQNRHDYRVALSVTQPLFDYRLFPGLVIADNAIERAEAAAVETTWMLDQATLQVYFNAVSARRTIEVSKRNVELARVNYERARTALELDVGLIFEVNRTEVALRAAERNLDNARLAYELALDSMATVLEVDPDEPFDVEEPPDLPIPDDVDELVENAVETRPELESIRLDAELAELRTEEVDARWWPTVQAQAQTWVQRGSAFGGDDFRWSLGVSANWLIFDGGYRLVDVDLFEVEAVQKRVERDIAARDAASEVRQAWLRVQTEQQQLANARAEAELAQLNVELTQEARGLDAATAVDVELAQQQRYLAELAVSRAEVGLQARIYELHLLAGILEPVEMP